MNWIINLNRFFKSFITIVRKQLLQATQVKLIITQHKNFWLKTHWLPPLHSASFSIARPSLIMLCFWHPFFILLDFHNNNIHFIGTSIYDDISLQASSLSDSADLDRSNLGETFHFMNSAPGCKKPVNVCCKYIIVKVCCSSTSQWTCKV